jgi:hypothetical protein
MNSSRTSSRPACNKEKDYEKNKKLSRTADGIHPKMLCCTKNDKRPPGIFRTSKQFGTI